MSDTRERKLRRALSKLNMVLHKSHARNWSYENQLGYMVTDLFTNACIVGSNYDYSLDDIEAWLCA